jgi:hypothetical protein
MVLNGSPPVCSIVTSVTAADITLLVGGVSVPFQGPFYTDVTHTWPFFFLQPETPLDGSSVVALTTTSGAIVCAAGSVPGVTAQAVTNYFGQDEQVTCYFSGVGVGNNKTIQVPGFGTMTPTLQLGGNVAWPTSADSAGTGWINANLFHRAFCFNVASRDSNGHPLTLSAAMTCSFTVGPASDTYIDQRGNPTVLGTYTFTYNDTAPSTPMTASITVNSAGSITASGSTPGMLVGGVQVGKTVWATIAYSNQATSQAITLTVNVATHGASYPGPYTLASEFLTPPDTVAQNTDETVPNPTFISNFTTPSNQVPKWLRFMDCTLGTGGVTNVVNPADMPSLTNFNWQNPESQGGSAGPTTVTISAIRNYDIGVSPNVYVDNNTYTNTSATPGGSPLPYFFAAPNNYFMNFSGNMPNNWAIGEAVCNSTAGLHSGTRITFGSSGFSGIPFTNGPSGTLNNTLNNFQCLIVVTSPTTFAFLVFLGSPVFTSFMPAPQYINGVSGTNTVSGTAVTVGCPDQHALPLEITARMAATIGSNLWRNIPQTATDATVTDWANKDVANTPVDQIVGVELSNEVWNFTSNQWLFALGALGAFHSTVMGREEAQCARLGQAVAIYKAVWTAAGRSASNIKCLLMDQFGSGTTANPLNGIWSSVNNLNAAFPGACPVDIMGGGPYIDMASKAAAPSVALFFASLYPTATDSLALGTPQASFPATRGQCNDMRKWHVKYDQQINGGIGLGGGGGWFQRDFNAPQLYIPTTPQAPNFVPELWGYEGSYQTVSPLISNTATFPSSCLQHAATHDLDYDPSGKDPQTALYEACQTGGYTGLVEYATIFPRSALTATTCRQWGLIQGQWNTWGAGDNSDGRGVNQFYVISGTDGTAGVHGTTFDATNVSPRLLAWRNWADIANGIPSPPPPPVYPTVTAKHIAMCGGCVPGGPRAVCGGPDDSLLPPLLILVSLHSSLIAGPGTTPWSIDPERTQELATSASPDLTPWTIDPNRTQEMN